MMKFIKKLKLRWIMAIAIVFYHWILTYWGFSGHVPKFIIFTYVSYLHELLLTLSYWISIRIPCEGLACLIPILLSYFVTITCFYGFIGFGIGYGIEKLIELKRKK